MESLVLIVGGMIVTYIILDFLTILMLRRLHDSLKVRVAAGIIAIVLGFSSLEWLWAILSAGNSGEGRYVLLAIELVLMRVAYITTWWIVAWVRLGLAISYGRAAVRTEDHR